MRESSLEEIYLAVRAIEDVELIAAANVPHFSQLESACRVPEILCMLGEPLTFDQLGVYLDYVPGKKETANKKYGENHAKLATLLDLAEIVPGPRLVVEQTPFTRLFACLSNDERIALAARLAFRIPIIQQLLSDARLQEVAIADYLKPFSESTKKRRRPNIKAILDLISSNVETCDGELYASIINVRP